MFVVKAHLKSMTPLSMSRPHNTPKLNDKELADDYERRTWRERLHYDEHGEIYIPPMMLKLAIADAAAFMGKQIPGKGKSTYRKHFDAGVLVMDPVMLGVKKEEADGKWLFLNADGVRGSGKRVQRCLPHINSWEGDATIYVLDEVITEPVFREHLDTAGSLIGIGQFRPRVGGYCGRFKVEHMIWTEQFAAA